MKTRATSVIRSTKKEFTPLPFDTRSSTIVKREDVDNARSLFGDQDSVKVKNEECKNFSQESPLVQQESQTKFSNVGGVIYNRDKRLCLTCNKTYTKFKGLYNHLIYIHKLKISFIRPSIKHANVVPDWDDPNFWCAACDTTYVSQAQFRVHIKRIHQDWYRQQQQQRRENLIHPEILPDKDDPNGYCKSCDKKFASREYYLYHLRQVHKMQIPKRGTIKNPHLQPLKDDPNNYCRACEKTLSTKSTYYTHINTVHRMNWTPPSRQVFRIERKLIVNSDVQPDINSPDFYCASCKKSYSTKKSYMLHLKYMHGIFYDDPQRFKRKPPNPQLTPDINDPNNYCQSCDYTYKSRYIFRSHLKKIHQISLERATHPKRPIKNPDLTPDPNDKDFYCCACDKHFNRRDNFYGHLRQVHQMKVVCKGRKPRESLIVNPSQKPDVLDPDFFCCGCQRKYVSAKTLHEHLRTIHKMSIREENRKVLSRGKTSSRRKQPIRLKQVKKEQIERKNPFEC